MMVRRWVHRNQEIKLSWRDLIKLVFGRTLLANGTEVRRK